jgi:hypothetical protein
MFKMNCPKCGAESKFSFVDNSYEGPRRCWGCHELFKMKILNNELIYCEPLSQEEFAKMQAANDLKSKFKRDGF